MSNVTFTVDEHTLRRARILALERGTSVNAMVREFLERTVAEASEGGSRADRFAALVAAGSVTTDQAGARWSGRASLYAGEPRFQVGEVRASDPPAEPSVHEPRPAYEARTPPGDRPAGG